MRLDPLVSARPRRVRSPGAGMQRWHLRVKERWVTSQLASLKPVSAAVERGRLVALPQSQAASDWAVAQERTALSKVGEKQKSHPPAVFASRRGVLRSCPRAVVQDSER